MNNKLLLCLFSLGLISDCSLAASCCGGGHSIPGVITSDDMATLSSTLSASKAHTEVYTNGDWHLRKDDELTSTLKVDATRIVNDRFQLGLGIPFIFKHKQTTQKNEYKDAGLGDITLMGGYEYLPDWDYNPYRPKGVGFITLTSPTGKSVYDEELNVDKRGTDARGRGFWSIGVGTILIKSWGAWDAVIQFEAHKSFSKTMQNGDRLDPGYGFQMGSGLGWNWGDLRLGPNLTWYYEDRINRTGQLKSRGQVSRYTTATISLSYMLGIHDSLNCSYSDQTLFGSPLNTSLGQSIALGYQHRWPR